MSWVTRLTKLLPVTGIATELVRFDTQAMDNPDISGVEYQQGALAGYELREYLLEKWGRTCAYCKSTNIPLQIEHIVPRSRGGSDRASNLTLSCKDCNQNKGDLTAEEFGYPAVQTQARKPLNDAAAVNATRWALFDTLKETSLPVLASSGGRTKWNRIRFGIPKSHCLDAVCVGDVQCVVGWQSPVLNIRCSGRGSYQRTRLDQFGFPRGYLTRQKAVKGFQTGDMVIVTVPAGKKAGIHKGRVAVRATGSFNIQTSLGVVQGVSHRHCKVIQRNDGYNYHYERMALLPDLKNGVSAPIKSE
jgi:5-methylcytosine-specific restriction endonuclease McrA